MEDLRFTFYFCGMSEKTFSDRIMLYIPHKSICRKASLQVLEERSVYRLGQWISSLKEEGEIRESLGEWGLGNFSVHRVYVEHRGCFFGLREDKPLVQIFQDLGESQLDFAYFLVGGASLHNETGYRFTVHPDERVHRHLPHVHVSKGGVQVRYSLETLLPLDPLVNPHKRDYKKVILPFLRQRQGELLEFWRCYEKGYLPPETDQKGRQFYRES